MNFSALKSAVCRYLSAHEMPKESLPDALIASCLEELERLDCFRSVCAEYTEPLPFLRVEPYASFLEGAKGYYLIACTLGIEIDRILRRLSVTDMPRMIVLDACANAYLEYRAEAWKQTLAPVLSYTFCPGYGGSKLSDLCILFEELCPARIGMELTDTNLMLPQKSLAGIVGIGITPHPKCGNCVKLHDCVFKREGKLCFRSEPN